MKALTVLETTQRQLANNLEYTRILHETLRKTEHKRDKYKAALEEIAHQKTPRNAFTMKHDSLVDIAKEALK